MSQEDRVGVVRVDVRNPRNPDVLWTAEVDFTKVIGMAGRGAWDRPMFPVRVWRNGDPLPNWCNPEGAPPCTGFWTGGLGEWEHTSHMSFRAPSKSWTDELSWALEQIEHEVMRATAGRFRDLTVAPMGIEEFEKRIFPNRPEFTCATSDDYGYRLARADRIQRFRHTTEQGLLFMGWKGEFHWSIKEEIDERKDSPTKGQVFASVTLDTVSPQPKHLGSSYGLRTPAGPRMGTNDLICALDGLFMGMALNSVRRAGRYLELSCVERSALASGEAGPSQGTTTAR